jgi:NAD(P)-dependent dehydrogenase (short-subunit alcohol dehydrogenase family)
MITGAGRGLGHAFAEEAVKNGDMVIATVRKVNDADPLMKNENVLPVIMDVTKKEDVTAAVDAGIRKFGRIDVLINNAGGALQISGGPKGEFKDMPMEYWDSQMALNLNSAAYLSRYAVEDMIEKKTEGRIVNISSVHGQVTWVHRRMLPYSAAKSGLNMFTKALGVEVAKYGIRVNCVAPGLIFTKLAERYSKEDLTSFSHKIPVGRGGTVEEIVPAIQFLSDIEKTRFIVGQVLCVDGGQSSDGSIESMNFPMNQ